jgi:hypothetical protein
MATNRKVLDARLWKETFRFQLMLLVAPRGYIFLFKVNVESNGIFISMGQLTIIRKLLVIKILLMYRWPGSK